MKAVTKTILMIAGAAGLLTTAACADYPAGYPHGRHGYGHADGYDVYYDGYYGPVREGYWDNDGDFHYRDAQRHWQRDQGRHFRRDSYNGYQSYRVYRGEH